MANNELENLDPLARMAVEMMLGRGEEQPPAKNIFERLGRVAGVIPSPSSIKGGLAGILPAGWKSMTPEAKAIMTEFSNMFPEWFRSVQKSPRELLINTVRDLPMGTEGTFEHINPLMDRIKLGMQKTIKGERPPGLDTVGHELTHYLTADKLAKMDPDDAATIGMLISDLLPKRGQGSLLGRMGELESLEKVIGPLAGKNVPARATEVANAVKRSIGGEGYAHLAERTVFPETSTKLQDLAMKLGVGAKASAPSTGSTLLDDVLQSLSQLGSK